MLKIFKFKKSIIFALFLVNICTRLFAEYYTRDIDGSLLQISSYAQVSKNAIITFNSLDGQINNVNIKYKETSISANYATFYEDTNQISLRGNILSRYKYVDIYCQAMDYDFTNGFFQAEDVTVSANQVFMLSEKLMFYNKKIELKKMSLGLNLVKLRASFQQLDLYPGWMVGQHMLFDFYSIPFFYVPTLVEDQRRNSYKLPEPLPEGGNSFFRGSYWRWNTHYYMNDYLYGNFHFGNSSKKGSGYGIQQIIRFSDYDHFTYIADNWQYSQTQEIYSFEHSFIEIPYSKKEQLTFNELLLFNQTLSKLPANSIRISRMRLEEINESILNRDIQIVYDANYKLPWQELNLNTKLSYDSLEELNTNLSGYKHEAIFELQRTIDLHGLIELTPGIGYDTSKYSIEPFSWHRLYNYLNGKKEVWIFEFQGKATDYIEEKGSSPFLFDKKFEYSDNIQTGIYTKILGVQVGRSTQYLTPTGKIVDNSYHLKFNLSNWQFRGTYCLTRETWSFAFNYGF